VSKTEPMSRTLSSAGSAASLRLQGLSKRYAGPNARQLLTSVDLALAPGDYVAIMGESGVGKSTLLNLVAGLDAPDSGTVSVDGVDLAGLDDDALTVLRREKLGFVFQAFHVLPYLSVARNVALPLELLDVGSGEVRARVDEMLAAVGLADRADSLPRELSGGELQRVAIARALIHRPSLVLADEPTGNLDPDNARQVLDLLRDRIKSQNAAGILVTHSLAAARTADRVLVLTPSGLQPAEQIT
jgi:putative ABC transport system ATP-binding protein